jgi:two-component system, sensor histidine kinase and response regulator
MTTHESMDAFNLEQKDLRISLIPTISSAPLAYAHNRGLFRKNGLNVELAFVPGWSEIKEVMAHGYADAAHMLTPMPLACSCGIDGKKTPLRLGTILSGNRQALILAPKHREIRDVRDMRGFVFGVPYRFSFSYYLLCHYLGEHGLNPLKDVTIQEIPPSRMPYHLEKGRVDALISPDPFSRIILSRGTGFLHAPSKDIWAGRPCSCLATSRQLTDEHPRTYRALLKSVLEAELAIHRADTVERKTIAREISRPEYLNQEDPNPVEQALAGNILDEGERHRSESEGIAFTPYSDEEYGTWILSQMQRWGQLPGQVDYHEVVSNVFQNDAYEIADSLGFAASDKARLEELGDFAGKDAFTYMLKQPFCAYESHATSLTDYGLSHQARQRLSDLVRQMAKIAEGDHDGNVTITSDDEIGLLEQMLGEAILSTKFNREALDEHTDELEKRVQERTSKLVTEVADRKRAEKKHQHLNGLLRAIRNVNQHIAREKDRDRLLQGACDSLCEARGYRNVWIALLDDSHKLTTSAHSSLHDVFEPLATLLKQGKLSDCLLQALSQSKVITIDDPISACGDDASGPEHREEKAVAVRLEYGGKAQGLIVAGVRGDLSIDEEERSLFEEVAADIGFALNSIQMEEERNRVEETLRLEQSRLETLLNLDQMTPSSMQEIMDFAMEEAVRLTNSQIGYLAFMNEEETVLTMYSWSKTAMAQCAIIDKPIVYPLEETGLWGEAARQRKPIITNDYTAHSPFKKGYPEGHVDITRHMNVPVLDGERVVAVAGVGNKTAPYDDSDIRHMTLLMQGMWRLIQRKRAQQELQEAHDELEHRVEKRTEELTGAYEDLKREAAEREQAEKVMKDSQALYSSLVENLPVHVSRKDREGRVTFANQSLCKLLGKQLDEIKGKTDYDLYPVELADKYRHDDLQVMETGELLETIEENQNDGEISYVQVMKSAVKNAQGKIVGIQIIFWEVTAHKKAETALEHERYLLHSLMDNLPHNIYFKDKDSRFIRINKALADNFRLKDASEAIGKTDLDFFTDEHAQEAMNDEQKIVQTGIPLLDKEEKETWSNGHTTWASTTKMPLYDDSGKVAGTFGISRNITEKKRTAEALRIAKDAAEAANRAKSEFLANMSHEIRTPMNGIIGMTELLLNTELTSQQFEYQGFVKQSADVLLRLLNDILDFSKIEAGRLELELIEFDFREVLGDTLHTLSMRASEKGLELASRIAPDTPKVLIGDPGRFRQIVVNLAGNAIKFTERGEVVVDVEMESLSEGKVCLHVAVRDTGIGIPPEKQQHIFEAFNQADNSTTRRFGGTGLGLAISSQLVEMMDGRMWVDSKVGEGSTFHFKAVFEAPRDVSKKLSLPPDSLHNLPVLIVDDNQTNRLILKETLINWGMNPTVASSGAEAIEELRQAVDSGEPFRLVLLDAMMPQMDGFMLAERIQQDPTFADVTLMMLSSAGQSGDMSRARNLGIVRCLTKPVKSSALLDAITQAIVLEISESETTGSEAPLVSQVFSRRILLAEDGLINQKVAVNLLKQRGHSVVIASNGKEAVVAYQRERFDLILMDIEMPEMDGQAAAAAIREIEKRKGGRIPIVAMTAHAMKGDRERFLSMGMDGYIAKPIDVTRLYETVESIAPAVDEPLNASNETLESENRFNHDTVLAAAGGDQEVVRELIELFPVECKKLCEDIRHAFLHEDFTQLKRAAHTLKGSLLLFGAQVVADNALKLEHLAEEAKQEEAKKVWTQLEIDVNQLLLELADMLE